MAEHVEREAERYKRDQWYEHIWYHYKWIIIAVLAVALLLAIVIVDMNKKDPVDMYLFYITEDPVVYREKIEALKKSISPYVEDVNGDGKITLQVKNIFIGDEYDAKVVNENKTDFRTIMWSGTNMFFVADKAGIDFLLSEDNGNGVLESLTDIAAADELLYDDRVWQANGSEFMQNDTFKDWEGELYFGLRLYTNTVAAIQKKSAKCFEIAHNALANMIKDTKLY